MRDSSTASTTDLMEVFLKPRPDLSARPVRNGESVSYLLTVPDGPAPHRVGWAEYVLISSLDGRTSLAAAVAISAQILGAEAISEHQASSLALWLLEQNLVSIAGQSVREDLEQSAGSSGKQQGNWNPLFLKLTLLRSDRWLKSVYPLMNWLFTKWGIGFQAVVSLVAIVILMLHWDRFWNSASAVLIPQNWLWFLVAWLLLKGLHETAHAACCRKYGSPVGSLGVTFLLFFPLAWVDVTSSWQLRSRWQRIHIAAAGMQVELMIAAISLVFWSWTGSPWLQQLLFHLILMASFTTVVFNANPLMRFDGYFILSDLLRIPNLGQVGDRATRILAGWFFFGDPLRFQEKHRTRLAMILIYGILSSIWRVIIWLSLMLIASVMLAGAGILLTLLALILSVSRKLAAVKTGHFWMRRSCNQLVRGGLIAGLLAIGIGGGMFFLRWSESRSSVGVVQYGPEETVRATAHGIVESIQVKEGQRVNRGDLLLVIRNPELETQLKILDVEMRQAKLRSDVALHQQEQADLQEQQDIQLALEKRREDLLKQVNSLQVRAPISGIVLTPNLPSRLGTVVREGEELLVIGDPAAAEVLVAIDQNDVNDFVKSASRGNLAPVRIRLPGRKETGCNLPRIDPRASRRIPHPALGTHAGGPLPVAPLSKENGTQETEEFQLLSPHFIGHIPLQQDFSADLYSGELAWVHVQTSPQPIGRILWQHGENWVQGVLDEARKRAN